MNGLLKVATPTQVLTGLGRIFENDPAEDWCGMPVSVVCSTTEEADEVDLFISHSWAAGRWQKTLAVCYHLNLKFATKVSILAWVINALTLFVFAGRAGELAGNPWVYLLTVDFPMAVFFFLFLFGQHFHSGPQRLWLDKLCIPQADNAEKQIFVQSLPTFVRRSSQMLVLWDGTYFERLWCNLEFAMFLNARNSERNALVVVPLWLPPWLLLTMLLDWISVRLLLLPIQTVSQSLAWHQLLEAPRSHWLCLLQGIWYNWCNLVAYMPAAMATAVSFRFKLSQHIFMLRQLENFDVRTTKCTLSADRPMLEAEIALLYDEIDTLPVSVDIDSPDDASPVPKTPVDHADRERLLKDSAVVRSHAVRPLTSYPSHSDCLQLFNAEVRGPLLNTILYHSGSSSDLPLGICMQAFAPLWFFLLSSSYLACDGFASCHAAIEFEGFASVRELYLVDIAYGLILAICIPTVFPTLLRMLHWAIARIDSISGQVAVTVLGAFLAYLYTFTLAGSTTGCMMALVVRGPKLSWLLLFGLLCSWSVCQWYVFYFRGSLPKWLPISCRCFTKHADRH